MCPYLRAADLVTKPPATKLCPITMILMWHLIGLFDMPLVMSIFIAPAETL